MKTGQAIQLQHHMPTLKANIRAKKREQFKAVHERPPEEISESKFFDSRLGYLRDSSFILRLWHVFRVVCDKSIGDCSSPCTRCSKSVSTELCAEKTWSYVPIFLELCTENLCKYSRLLEGRHHHHQFNVHFLPR